ncbi:hypothetical protein XfCFBP8356_000610 [Xylella fastidiosa subsp. sandyi]|nr:hypothetical protein [Xylella fastidiosa]WNY20131.1 hypothetical protein RO839_00620 [Xylella fastidiosa]WNY22423.1 hypothetical protein RO838_00615 [Xylella fastidiosa]
MGLIEYRGATDTVKYVRNNEVI